MKSSTASQTITFRFFKRSWVEPSFTSLSTRRQPPSPRPTKRYRLLNRFGLLGAFVGLAVLWGLTLHHPLFHAHLKVNSMLRRHFGHSQDKHPRVGHCVLERGLLHAFIKPTWLKLLRSGNSFSQAVRGSIVLGIRFQSVLVASYHSTKV